MKRPVLSYANVMSTIGVFIALGGTSYAVARNSIGTRELKNNAVTSAKVRNGSLGAADLKASIRKQGPRGPRGPQGPPGSAGGAGGSGAMGAAEAWKALALIGGWTNYGNVWENAGYRKDQLGIVHLRGLVTRGGPADPPTGTIAVLPDGYRPLRARLFVVQTGETASVGRVDVHPDGEVIWIAGASGEEDYTSLDEISFDTD
jgi:hypothetical protein